MATLKQYNQREVLKILRKNGFKLKREGKGSHQVWQNPTTGKQITVSLNPNKMKTKRMFEEAEIHDHFYNIELKPNNNKEGN